VWSFNGHINASRIASDNQCDQFRHNIDYLKGRWYTDRHRKEGMHIMLPELKYLYKNMVHKTRPAFWEQHAM